MGRPSTAEWHAYLRHFHHDRPGITEAVLSRARGHGQTPYEWLIDGLDHGDRVVDLACGSGPTRHLTGPAWIGLDASHDELAARGPPAQRAVAQGDLTELPVRSGACDTAVCSMALMLVDPLAAAVAEIRRIVRPGGTLRLLLPARRPLTPVDLARYASLAAVVGRHREAGPLEEAAGVPAKAARREPGGGADGRRQAGVAGQVDRGEGPAGR